jgi:hypothetical protein
MLDGARSKGKAATSDWRTSVGDDGLLGVDDMWAKGGHRKAYADTCADRSLVRADPVHAQVWAGNGSVLSRLSIWVGPLAWFLPIFFSRRMRSDARCLFGSARWRCPRFSTCMKPHSWVLRYLVVRYSLHSLILPPFLNIRCFSFVKQMYLYTSFNV